MSEEQLQGRWTILAVEEDGVRDHSEPSDGLIATIADDEFVVQCGREDLEPSTARFRLDPAAHHFDFVDPTGVVSPGIYSLDHDNLLICVNLNWSRRPLKEQQPPSGFFTVEGSGWRLWVMQRLRPA
jgi:uncharacterized protein (TIGR03067 family)